MIKGWELLRYQLRDIRYFCVLLYEITYRFNPLIDKFMQLRTKNYLTLLLVQGLLAQVSLLLKVAPNDTHATQGVHLIARENSWKPKDFIKRIPIDLREFLLETIGIPLWSQVHSGILKQLFCTQVPCGHAQNLRINHKCAKYKPTNIL